MCGRHPSHLSGRGPSIRRMQAHFEVLLPVAGLALGVGVVPQVDVLAPVVLQDALLRPSIVLLAHVALVLPAERRLIIKSARGVNPPAQTLTTVAARMMKRTRLDPRSKAAFRARPASPTAATAAMVAGAARPACGWLLACDTSATSRTPLLCLASPAYRDCTSAVAAIAAASWSVLAKAPLEAATGGGRRLPRRVCCCCLAMQHETSVAWLGWMDCCMTRRHCGLRKQTLAGGFDQYWALDQDGSHRKPDDVCRLPRLNKMTVSASECKSVRASFPTG